VTTVYYSMSYRDYKARTHLMHGVNAVGHSTDDPMTDESLVVLKVTAPDHVHHHFEKLGAPSLHPSHNLVVALEKNHPVMRHRGTT